MESTTASQWGFGLGLDWLGDTEYGKPQSILLPAVGRMSNQIGVWAKDFLSHYILL